MNKLVPGELIYTDQYESQTPGRTVEGFGSSSAAQFTGGTIFYDAASGYVHVAHQVGRTANETIQSKIAFERMAAEVGVVVQNYHSDNGVYKSHEFLKELMSKGQGIKMSGVSAHHQNGAAKNAIKIVVAKA